jgi:AraC-like DNA-binding protein
MADKEKYTLISYRNNTTEHPEFLNLKNKIEVIDLITFYYYLLYPNKSYEGEIHNYYELYVILSGKAKVKSGDKEYSLLEKDFIITPPGTQHAHNPDNSFLSSVSICFSAKGLQDSLICNKVGSLDNEKMNVLNILINEYINNYEYQPDNDIPYVKKVEFKNEYAYPQMFKCGLEMILIQITRYFQNESAPAKINIQREYKKNKVVEYIKEHYKEKIALEDIAKKFNYSVGHLCRKFKEEIGVSVVNYIVRYRISIAMKLLFERQELSIEEIALDVGFNDVQFFDKTFKKITGMTPGKYRKEVNETKALHAQDIMFIS